MPIKNDKDREVFAEFFSDGELVGKYKFPVGDEEPEQEEFNIQLLSTSDTTRHKLLYKGKVFSILLSEKGEEIAAHNTFFRETMPKTRKEKVIDAVANIIETDLDGLVDNPKRTIVPQHKKSLFAINTAWKIVKLLHDADMLNMGERPAAFPDWKLTEKELPVIPFKNGSVCVMITRKGTDSAFPEKAFFGDDGKFHIPSIMEELFTNYSASDVIAWYYHPKHFVLDSEKAE